MSNIKLKQINPGMIIHCKNKQEYDQLNEESVVRGYGELPCETLPNTNIEELVFYIRNSGVLWGYLKDVKNVIEFSDLIEPELTAEEVLEILSDIKNCKGRTCDNCPLSNYCAEGSAIFMNRDNKKLLEICRKWKADHEKKEPEGNCKELLDH